MTDGITSSRRDNDICNQIDDINDLQKVFSLEPSIDLANKIIRGLSELERMRKGYRISPPYEGIKELREKYNKYLSSGNPHELIELLASKP